VGLWFLPNYWAMHRATGLGFSPHAGLYVRQWPFCVYFISGLLAGQWVLDFSPYCQAINRAMGLLFLRHCQAISEITSLVSSLFSGYVWGNGLIILLVIELLVRQRALDFHLIMGLCAGQRAFCSKKTFD